MGFFTQIAGNFSGFVNGGGYFRIFWMMTLESTSLPIILPAELVLITAGYGTLHSDMNTFLVILTATLGSVCGSFLNYYFAYFVGKKLLYRYGPYILISKARVQLLEKVFVKHAAIITLSGRLMPLIKHVVSIPAGMCAMNKWKFCFYTALGSGILSASMVFLGRYLGNRVQQFSEYKWHIVAATILVSLLTIVLYYIYNRLLMHISRRSHHE